MKIKKIIGLLIAAAIIMSMCVISVSASGFTSANKANGTVTEVKGNNLPSEFNRVHSGESGTTRTSVTQTAITEVTAEKNLILAYDTSNTGYSGKFAHATFKLEMNKGGVQIRIRNGSSGNIQFMRFEVPESGESGGNITPTSGTAGKGLKWSTGEHRIDIVSDLQNGMSYMYYDKQLAGYQTNTMKTGKWYGYLIYKLSGCTWESGDYVRWSNYDHKEYQYTLYNDTANYTVSLEDVLVQAGIEDGPAEGEDASLILTTDKMQDYYNTSNSASVTFSGNSTTVSGDYYNASSGFAQAFYYMLSGFYQDGQIYPGGGLIYVSFDQQISAGSRIEIRLRSGGSNNNDNRLMFLPNNGKIRVYAFDGTRKVLNKNYTDSINVGIVVDTANKKAYVALDGVQIGEAYTYSNDFRDLRLYMNGTEENSVSTVTFSNWTAKFYDTSKDAKELLAQIAGFPVYFSEAGNTLEVEDDAFGLAVTAKKTTGSDDVSAAKLIAAVYGENDELLGLDQWNYSDGATNDELVFDRTGSESYVKVFCWTPGQAPLAHPNVLSFPKSASSEE